jgi:sarcosine oxidase gamma subunit
VGAPASVALARIEAFADTPAFRAVFKAALGVEPPGAGRWIASGETRILFAEEKAWYASVPAGPLADQLAEVAAVSDVSGAFRALSIEGPATLDILSLETFFPTADRGLGAGDLVATLLRHAPVLMVVKTGTAVDLLVPPSYAHDMAEGLVAAAARSDR